MRCFEHNDVEAVAVCKNCGKGACANCTLVSATKVVCSRKCLKKIKYAQEISKLKRKIAKVKKEQAELLAILCSIAGVIVSLSSRNSFGVILVIIGVLMYLWASVNFDGVIEEE